MGTDSGTGAVRGATMPAAVAVLIALVLAGGLFAGLWFGTKKITHLGILAGVLLAIAVPTTAYLGYEMWDYHEDPEFCSETCHVVEAQFDQFSEPGINRVIISKGYPEIAPDGGCYNCHLSGHDPRTVYWTPVADPL